MHSVEWDNLRYVLAVSRTGSLAKAARTLKVDRTTVLRRIRSYETQLQTKLFERAGAGYVLSPEASVLLRAAEDIEAMIGDAELKILGRELEMEGEILLTSTETLISTVLGPAVASFSKKHPLVKVKLLVANQVVSLSRREADIAVRPTLEPPSHLSSDYLMSFDFGLYATPDYLKGAEKLNMDEHEWVGLDGELLNSAPGKWQEVNLNEANFSARSDSFTGLRTAAENHMGVAHLPSYYGDRSTLLKRIPSSLPTIKMQAWILTHPNIRNAARIKTLIQHLVTELGD